MFHLDKPVLVGTKFGYETRSQSSKMTPSDLCFPLESQLGFASISPLTGAAVCVGTGCPKGRLFAAEWGAGGGGGGSVEGLLCCKVM